LVDVGIGEFTFGDLYNPADNIYLQPVKDRYARLL